MCFGANVCAVSEQRPAHEAVELLHSEKKEFPLINHCIFLLYFPEEMDCLKHLTGLF